MTNTFGQPLEIKHDRIDPVVLEVIREIDRVVRKCETEYFLAGATAREILLRHIFGMPSGRRTLDVDFGIAVHDWDHFGKLKFLLAEEGNFEAHRQQAQRLIHRPTKVRVDLIPFGGVQRSDGTISWPSEADIVMQVSGFPEALNSAVWVRLDENLVIRVVSLPALLILKLLAWLDRKYERRDADDIYTILRQYGEAGNEDRLYGDKVSILESENFDFELAGAHLIGSDAAHIISAETKRRIRDVLRSDEQMLALVNQIITSSRQSDADHVRRCELLVMKMREGFLGEQ